LKREAEAEEGGVRAGKKGRRGYDYSGLSRGRGISGRGNVVDRGERIVVVLFLGRDLYLVPDTLWIRKMIWVMR